MRSSIISERLLMTPLDIADGKFFFELLNTEDWIKYIGDKNIHSPEKAITYIKKIVDNPNTHYWVIRLKNELPVGIISFIQRDYLDHPDIGFALLPSFTGKGHAYEAAKAVLDHIIYYSSFSHILGITLRENIPSIRLLTKLGFSFMKVIDAANEKLQLFGVSADKLSISAITASFFNAFTNTNKTMADLELLNRICLPQVSIIHQKEYESDIYDLTSFIEPRRKMLSDGTLTDFEEKEVFEQTKIVEQKAFRYSKYEKTGVLNGKHFKQSGHKLFQFIKTGESWKISSVRWEDAAK